MLCEFATGIDGQKIAEKETAQELDLDVEIAMLVSRYYELLLDELAEEKVKLEEQIRQSRIENAQKQKKIYELMRETSYWKTKYMILVELGPKQKRASEISTLLKLIDEISMDEF